MSATARSIRCTYDLQKDFEPIALISTNPQLIVGTQDPAGERPQGADRLAEGQSRQGHARHARIGGPRTSPACLLQKATGTQLRSSCPIAAPRPAHAGSGGRADRSPDRAAGRRLLPQVRAGTIKAFAVMRQEPLRGRARHPDRRTRPACPACTSPVWFALLGAARARRRRSSPSSTPRWSRRSPTRRSAQRLADLGQDIPPREQQTPEALARLPQGRDRQMVADHQGRQHQGGVSRRALTPGRERNDDIRCLRSALATLAGIAGAHAQTYPSRPITMVVPFPAGGADRHDRPHPGRAHARTARPDRSSSRTSPAPPARIGVGRVARAAPDGYTHQHRPLGHACRQRRDLSAAIRPAQRFRAGRAARRPIRS